MVVREQRRERLRVLVGGEQMDILFVGLSEVDVDELRPRRSPSTQ
jgi:hypothetical protein